MIRHRVCDIAVTNRQAGRQASRQWSRQRGLLAASLLLVSVVIGGHSSAAANPTITGNPIESQADARHLIDTSRVVSVDGAITEIVYALGMEDRLVGVDTTSIYPDAARALPQVGYLRALSAEGVLSLTPTVLIGSADAGPAEVIEQIEGSGVPVHLLDTTYSLEGVLARVETLAAWFEVESRGEKLMASIRSQAESAINQQPLPSQNAEPGVLFLLGTDAGSAMAAGTGTAADAMINYAGGRNLFASHQGYKPIGTEALVAARPDVIVAVLHSEADPQAVIDSVLSIPGVSITPAGETGSIVVADAMKILGFGPRVGQAIDELAGALHR